MNTTRKTPDLVEVVRCGECAFFDADRGVCDRSVGLVYAKEDCYCSYGERSNENAE